MSDRSPIDLAELRERLATLEGQRYWRSLEELADSPAFRDMVVREFPSQAAEWADPVGRRRFLQLMGASIAFAGMTACSRPPTDVIVPYVKQPEGLVPGRPLFYATALTLGGIATGVLVKSQMGRPVKVEGNPEHPASLGATDVFAQASVLTLYDPDRSKTVTHLGEIRPYSDFLGALRAALEAQKARRGAGLRILTGSVTSPTLAGRLTEILQDYPLAKWHQYEAVSRDHERAGAIAAFGQDAAVQYRFDRADVVVSLGADFLGGGPGHVRYVRDFTGRRRAGIGGAAGTAGSGRDSEEREGGQEGRGHGPGASAAGGSPGPGDAATHGVDRAHEGGTPLDPEGGRGTSSMNRLYVVETMLSTTGAMADHRWPLRPSAVRAFALWLAGRIGGGAAPSGAPLPAGIPAGAADALFRDLERGRGRGIVAAGREQAPIVHAAAHAINLALGNAGATVLSTAPIEALSVDHGASMRELAGDMESGRVDLLIVLGGNPAFEAPADLRFVERMEKVALRVHLGLYDDETAARCHWHVPQAHELESWGDARAFDGTATILQPLIAPLYGGRTEPEILEAFSARSVRSAKEIVREHWSRTMGSQGDVERAWNRALHDGVVEGTAFPPRALALQRGWASAAEESSGRASSSVSVLPPTLFASSAPDGSPARSGEGDAPIEIAFHPDPSVYDGRFANNGWLQEMPRPITKITWENAALVAPGTAERQGLANGDLVDLTLEGRTVRAPVWIAIGHADGAVTVHLGYGRSRAGRVGTGAGFNVYAIRSSSHPWSSGPATLRRTGARSEIATTQEHHSMEGRDLVRGATIEEYREDPHFAHRHEEEPSEKLTLYPPHEYKGYAWGMAIDLASCVGCNACAVACQAENNVPIVGKEQVARGREMHWLRIDRYFEGGLDNPEVLHQPVLCMHCENAPCELVCPVAATVHSSEGLNDMVYNRCVGTRYCSNNCPYKVRRFNFLQFSDLTTPSLQLLHNPDVTVRTRGVMEKCTYCVQRINHARNDAEVRAASAPGGSGDEGASGADVGTIRDGEIVTACQQACPAGAIVFGDINDSSSRVARLKADPRNYGLLAELNTRPRTTYLAAVKNPNPEIAREATTGSARGHA